MKFDKIHLGTKLKSRIYLSILLTLLLGTGIMLYLLAQENQHPGFIIVVSSFLLTIILPVWYFETYSYLHLLNNNRIVSIIEGAFPFRRKIVFDTKAITKMQCKKYKDNQGSNKNNGGVPYTYNRPHDNSGYDAPSYAFKIYFNNRRPIEFGKYISKKQFKQIRQFITTE